MSQALTYLYETLRRKENSSWRHQWSIHVNISYNSIALSISRTSCCCSLDLHPSYLVEPTTLPNRATAVASSASSSASSFYQVSISVVLSFWGRLYRIARPLIPSFLSCRFMFLNSIADQSSPPSPLTGATASYILQLFSQRIRWQSVQAYVAAASTSWV